MVAAVHSGVGRIAVPKFPDGRSSMLYHIAETGVVLLQNDAHGLVQMAAMREAGHEMLHTQYAAAHMVFIRIACDIDNVL